MFTIQEVKVKEYPEIFVHKMIKKGKYRRIGSGAYADVYAKSKADKQVIKVGEVKRNKGYLGYLRMLAKQKTHNPFTPKITEVVFYTMRGEDAYFVVKMERLTRLPDRLESVVDWFEEELDDRCYGSYALRVLGIQEKLPLNLKNLLKLLRKAEVASKGRFDMHYGNFMMRGKQIVCTDPLF